MVANDFRFATSEENPADRITSYHNCRDARSPAGHTYITFGVSNGNSSQIALIFAELWRLSPYAFETKFEFGFVRKMSRKISERPELEFRGAALNDEFGNEHRAKIRIMVQKRNFQRHTEYR